MINRIKHFIKFRVLGKLYNTPKLSKPINNFSHPRVILYDKLIEQTSNLGGSIVECGVGAGVSLNCICQSEISISKLKENNPREVFAFDSFEGFPEPSIHDKSSRNLTKGQALERNWFLKTKSLYDELKLLGIDENKIKLHLVKGFFETTLINEKLDKKLLSGISFLHLDVDIYNSYKICLEALYPHMLKGGIIIFDEYLNSMDKFPGAVRAIDEFFGDEKINIKHDLRSNKYYIVV
jgi:hypothetical protein